MGLHQDTVHAEYVEGCDACRWSSVSVAPSATPTRKGGAEAARINDTEKEWARDMRAYKAIRKDGLQPPRIDGAHKLEGATDKLEVEAGSVFPSDMDRKKVRENLAIAAEFNAALNGHG